MGDFSESGWGSDEDGLRFVLVKSEVVVVNPIIDIMKAVSQVGWW